MTLFLRDAAMPEAARLSRRALLLGGAALSSLGAAAAPRRIPTAAAKAVAEPAALPFAPRRVPRRILALYDSAVEPHLYAAPIHTHAALPLEYLGLTVQFHDIQTPLPPWDDPDLRGAVAWFPEPCVQDFASLVTWAEHLVGSGRRLVVLGDLAPKPNTLSDAAADALQFRLLATLHMRSQGGWLPVTDSDRIVHAEPDGRIGFEHGFEGEALPPFELFEPTDSSVHSWLVVERTGLPQRSHLVTVSPAGGFVAPGYAHANDDVNATHSWRIDPFAFFEAALDTADLPRGDSTTLCGRRIYYSHIDGDGWRSISQVHLPGGARASTAEILLSEVIAPNPDLPVTVAPIAEDLGTTLPGGDHAAVTARALFALEQVEVGSHTFSHPFDWGFFADWTPEKERPYAASYLRIATDGTICQGDAADQADTVNKGASKYPYSVPRAYGDRPFSLHTEIDEGARVIEALAPAGKRCAILQWSGNCLPFPAAMAAVEQSGLGNINGGDTRFDDDHPTVSAVAPVGRRHPGGQIQIYSSNSNENTYTELWTNRYFGFRDLPVTWHRTESPRRLKPMNMYYHMYSGERHASLDALLANIAFLRGQEFIGVRTSRFAAAARGTFGLQLMQEARQAWRVLDRGGLQTLRFPRGQEHTLDLVASEGVLGERVVNDELYVALDPDNAAPRVALMPRRTASPSRPLLVQAGWEIRGLTITKPTDISFSADGLGSGQISWHVPQPGLWHASQADGHTSETTAGDDHLLLLTFPAPVKGRIRLWRA